MRADGDLMEKNTAGNESGGGRQGIDGEQRWRPWRESERGEDEEIFSGRWRRERDGWSMR